MCGFKSHRCYKFSRTSGLGVDGCAPAFQVGEDRIVTGSPLNMNSTQEKAIDDGISELVFVEVDIMLGDADGSITGSKIMPRSKWDESVKRFNEYLEKEGVEYATSESEFFGEYRIDLDNYTVQSCSKEEARVLTKFLGSSNGDFRFPSEFV